MSTAERIKELEDHLRDAQYNKHTEHAFGVIKAQIARLREKLEAAQSKKTGGTGFSIKKSGDATVILLGFPSVGKSTLLNKITNAQSRVAAYAFTTLTVVPGTFEYNHAKIQVLDVPGIIEGASRGKGRGKEVITMVRTSDLILILVDALHPEHYSAILNEIYDAGIRINQKPPDLVIAKTLRGGITINTTVPLTKITKETILSILKEFRLNNADLVIRTDITADQLIDVIQGNRHYIPAITILAKIDLLTEEQLKQRIKQLKPDILVSAEKNVHINELKHIIYERLAFIRIYLKETGQKADLDVPLVLRKGATLRNVCEHIHKDFVRKFKNAKIWGPSAKFPGQQFKNIDKILIDEDIVEVHVR